MLDCAADQCTASSTYEHLSLTKKRNFKFAKYLLAEISRTSVSSVTGLDFVLFVCCCCHSQVGYVLQDDCLLPSLTVHETLSYVGRLKLPPEDFTEFQIEARVSKGQSNHPFGFFDSLRESLQNTRGYHISLLSHQMLRDIDENKGMLSKWQSRHDICSQ